MVKSHFIFKRSKDFFFIHLSNLSRSPGLGIPVHGSKVDIRIGRNGIINIVYKNYDIKTAFFFDNGTFIFFLSDREKLRCVPLPEQTK